MKTLFILSGLSMSAWCECENSKDTHEWLATLVWGGMVWADWHSMSSSISSSQNPNSSFPYFFYPKRPFLNFSTFLSQEMYILIMSFSSIRNFTEITSQIRARSISNELVTTKSLQCIPGHGRHCGPQVLPQRRCITIHKMQHTSGDVSWRPHHCVYVIYH